ncbi:MAG: hydrogenase/urease maturation nickel metallochaperone HypA, partial [Thermoleophilaceae bacterium]
EQTVVPARLHCSACGLEWTLEHPLFRCSSCGDAAVAVVSGNEFEVESIDVEEEEPCISRR